MLALQVSFVGLTEEQARDKAQAGGYGDKVAVSKTSFKANSKALAEKEGEGMAKLIYRWALLWGFSPKLNRCGWPLGMHISGEA